MFRISPIVKHLLILNIIIFFGINLSSSSYLNKLFSLHFPLNNDFGFWQIISHMFMHGNFNHLLFNMFALWMFGVSVERTLGQKKFLFFYITCGFGALTLQLIYSFYNFYSISEILISNGYSIDSVVALLNDFSFDVRWKTFLSKIDFINLQSTFYTQMVGASGAIMGVLVAFGMKNPNAELMLIFFPIPIKAKYFIPGIILLDLFSAITGVSIFSPSNTAYIAHIGGALTGFIIMYFWKKNQFDRYRWN